MMFFRVGRRQYMTAHRTGPRTLGGNFWLNLQQMKSLALSVVKTLHWRRQTEWDLSVRVDLAGLWLPVTLQEVTSTIKISLHMYQQRYHILTRGPCSIKCFHIIIGRLCITPKLWIHCPENKLLQLQHQVKLLENITLTP